MRNQPTIIQALTFFCFVLLGGCGGSAGNTGEKIPMNVGDFLVYHDANDARLVMAERIELKPTPDPSQRHYNMVASVFFKEDPSDVKPNKGGGRDYLIDLSGTILGRHDGSGFSSMGREQVQGRLVKLWLPTARRAAGKTVEFAGFPRPLRVVDQIEWETWQAWRVNFGEHTFYFDVETGFLVGRTWEGQHWVLQESSIPNLTEQ